MNKIIDYFKKLPSNRIDQVEPFYSDKEPCCVGAHLAKLLMGGTHYYQGKFGLLKELKKTFKDMNSAHVELMFRQIGVFNPWSGKSWKKPPVKVFQKLFAIEKLPELRGADLSNANLMYCNLKGADFTGADLTGANLIDANLTGADLTGADLTGADFTGANLEGAKNMPTIEREEA